MTEVRMTTDPWQDDLVNLLDDATIPFVADPFDVRKSAFVSAGQDSGDVEPESFKDQVKEFTMAWGQMMLELGKGFKDIVEQNLMTEDSFVVQKLGKPCAKVSGRLRFLNEYLPEDRDPVHAWPVILSVFILALAVISINSGQCSPIRNVKKVQIHPPSATRIQLPDGRHIAYNQQGVPADRARLTIMIPHSFLFSRLAGIPGVKAPLLKEYGLRLITYDLPGFGESDPHPSRNLNSSAFDMLYLANAVGVTDKFWVFGFSSASMHTWAALKYIPDRVAGVALVAPMVNPYEPTLSKEERSGAWANWGGRRKLLYFLSRRFPSLLSVLYRRKFFSGQHGQIDDWLSLTLQGKDEVLAQEPSFGEYCHRNVEESIRQGSSIPFVEESTLLVSNWGFKLSDFQLQRICQTRGLLSWLKSVYSQDQCELTGFLGSIHVWQGMEDKAVPPAMTDYIARVLPQATIHRLPNEGHFSYLFFCDGCHRRIFSTLFGAPQGPIDKTVEEEDSTELPSPTETSSSTQQE